MTAATQFDLARLFKRCLHLGSDVSVIERAITELRSLPIDDVCDHFDHCETQLAPLLFWHARRKGLGGRFGDRLSGELERRYQRNVARNSVLQRNLERIIARVSGMGIRVLVLKGACVFTKDLAVFRNAFVLSDIDLLVLPADFRETRRILLAEGYSLVHNQAMNGRQKQGFVGTDGVTRIDLHSALFWTSAGEYLDYGPSNLWKGSLRRCLGRYPVYVLSPTDQICHRLVHDTLGHGDSVLPSSTCRLYYFCALVDYYRDRIDWRAVLHSLERNGADRLLIAYLNYGNRELGLAIPRAVESICRRERGDLAMLDAVLASTPRLTDYAHRTSVVLLTSDTVRARVHNLYRSFTRHWLLAKGAEQEYRGAARHFTLFVKVLCLQLAAVLYMGAYGIRHSIRETRAHV